MDAVLTGMFSVPAGAGVSVEDFLLRLLVAYLAGQLIGWIYSASHGVLSYSQNFVQSLVMLSMIISVIMGVVGDSLARAFGLGAALAIVRFRTPIKDARDTTFLFLAVAVGMAAGAGQLLMSILAAVVVGSVAMFMYWSGFGSRSQSGGMLRFRYSGTDDERPGLDSIMTRHCRNFVLSGIRSGATGREFVYDVNLKSDGAAATLVEELTATGWVSGVTLLPQARAGEG